MHISSCPSPDDTIPPEADKTDPGFVLEVEMIDLAAEDLEEDGITSQ